MKITSFSLLVLSLTALLVLISPAVSALEQCGRQNPSGNCPSYAPCCSQWGFCGNSTYYCDPMYKCQSNCWTSSVFAGTPSTTTRGSSNAPTSTNQSPTASGNPKRKPEPTRISSAATTSTQSSVPTQTAPSVEPSITNWFNGDEIPNESEDAELAALMKDDVFREHESPHYDPRGLYSGCFVKNAISMTYDDGPSVEVTNEILDHLAAANVTATFFVIGSNVKGEAARATIRRAHQAGHIIASHTWSHPHLPDLSDSEIIEEMRKTEDVLHSILGFIPRYMRPPYGEVNERVKRVLMEKLGYSIILWNLDTNDWDVYKSAPHKIYQEYEKQLYRFAAFQKQKSWIPLQHDLYKETAEHQPRILSFIKSQGYRFISMTECLRDTKGPYRPRR